jgi:hypothetical protein
LQNSDLVAQRNVSSWRAARLFIADKTTTSIIAIQSNAESSSLWNVCNPHPLNRFDIYENHNTSKSPSITRKTVHGTQE